MREMKGLNLSKFKKVSSDERHTTLRHEAGHELRIAHSALSPKMREQLMALEQHPEPAMADSKIAPKIAPKMMAPGGYVDDNKHVPVVVNVNPPSPAQAAGQSAGQALRHSFETSPTGLGLQAAQAALPYVEQAGQGLVSGATGQPLPSGDAAAAPAAPAADGTLKGTESAQTVPSNAQPGLNIPSLDTPTGITPKSIYQTGMAGIQKEKEAEQLGAQERLSAAQHNIDAITQQALSFQQGVQDKTQDINNAVEDLRNGHINPNHFIESQSSLGKVATAIGLILGGAGGGLTHQENPALKFLNAQIDRDIDAQKQDLGKRQTLLNAYQKQFDNITVAANMTKATQLALYASQLDAAAFAAANPAASARALQASAALKQQMLPLVQQAQLLHMTQQSGKGPDLMDLERFGVIPKEYHEQADKEMKSVLAQRNAVAGVKDIYGKFNQEQTATNLLNPQSSRRVDALNGQLVNLIMEASPSKRLTEEAVKQEIKPFSIKTTDDAKTRAAKMHGVMDIVRRNADPTPLAEKYGIFRPNEMYSEKPKLQEGATGTYNGKPVVVKNGRWQYR
jgi:hypothetical protein